MLPVLISVLAVLRGVMRSRVALHLEVLALRHQLQVFDGPDRDGCASRRPIDALGLAVTLVERLANATRDREATRHRQGFRVFWTWRVVDASGDRPSPRMS